MSTFFAIALAVAAGNVQDNCSWDRPGANPYTGTTDAAIDRYTDIPADVRDKLKRRMKYGKADETVEITRDAISGKYTYGAAIRDMHFGAAKVCQTVTRANWTPTRVEPAAVYCADNHCILVPQICGNVSRITRQGLPAVAGSGKDAPSSANQAAATPRVRGAALRDPELGLVSTPTFNVAAVEKFLGEAPASHGNDAAQAPGNRDIAWQPPEGDELPPLNDDGVAGVDGSGIGVGVDSGNAGGGAGGAGGKGGGAGNGAANPVSPVPEPGTWAMLLGGLALVAVAARRKQGAGNSGS